MNDDTDAGQPEGEALPVPEPMPAHHADARVSAAVDRWYADHYHRCALAGVAPLSADDKAALIQHVADAVAPAATQE